MAHLIDSQRYRDMQFATMADSVISPMSVYEEPPPVVGHYTIITVREIPLRDKKGIPLSVRAFEIQGPLLPDAQTHLRQLAIAWSMRLAGLPEMQRRAVARMRCGSGQPPQTVFEMSQAAISLLSPWYWAISAPRREPIPRDIPYSAPSMYVEDFTEYPSVYAAFDALMHRVRERWSGKQPWAPQEASVLS